MRGLPAKAALRGNHTEEEFDHRDHRDHRDRGDEVFHFQWGIPEGGVKEGVAR